MRWLLGRWLLGRWLVVRLTACAWLALLLDLRELGTRQSRQICSRLQKEFADQAFVLTPGVCRRGSLRFTVLANKEEELEEIVTGNPVNSLDGRPGLKTKTSGSTPQVPLITDPATSILSGLLHFTGVPALPIHRECLLLFTLLPLELLMQIAQSLLGRSNRNRCGFPGISGPAGALDRKTFPLPSIGSSCKGTRVIRLIRKKTPLEVFCLPAVGAGFLAKEREGWMADRPSPSQITHHIQGVQSAVDPVLGKRARHRVLRPTPTTRGRRAYRQTSPTPQERYGSSS